MSLISVLRTIGKDLSHVGGWIDDGLKVVQPIVGAVDPPLGAIMLTVEKALDNLPTGTTITKDILQKIVTSAATVATPDSKTCPCPCCPMKTGGKP